MGIIGLQSHPHTGLSRATAATATYYQTLLAQAKKVVLEITTYLGT